MKQQSFAAGDFECFRKPTRREQFLAAMDKVVPWYQPCQRIEPFYPKAGSDRPPAGLERMLRIYFPSTGSTCRIRVRKKPSISPARCVALSALT
jgi:hypothetical protein